MIDLGNTQLIGWIMTGRRRLVGVGPAMVASEESGRQAGWLASRWLSEGRVAGEQRET